MERPQAKINISALLEYAMSIEHFELKYRFTEEAYTILPPDDLSEIIPLNPTGDKKVFQLIDKLGIRRGYELNENYFSSIVDLHMRTVSDADIHNWLDDLKIPANKEVILTWDSWGTVVTKWHIFQKYYTDFFYPVSDDLMIFDGSMNWVLYLFHEEIMYYGRSDDIVIG